MQSSDLKFSQKTHPKRPVIINNGSSVSNDVNQPIIRRQQAYEGKRIINNEETAAEYIEAERQIKTVVKQEKRNKEESVTSFYSYINGIRIVRDNIEPLKPLDEIVISTVIDMANTMNNFYSYAFTIEHLNNVPQLDQYECNILDSFNFRTEKVQENLLHLNIYCCVRIMTIH